MFRLYKQRNFSELINDTFAFFRTYGKSYFKGYFIINGGLLLTLLVLMYLMGSFFVDTLSTGISNPTGGESIITENIQTNFGMFMLAGLAGFVLILIITLLSYSYPVIFLNLLEKNRVPATKEIVGALLKKTGRIILFGLLWLVTFLPIIIVAGLLSMVLLVIIIGIPFALIILAAVTSWMYLSFIDYLSNNSGYFEAMKNGFNILFQNFWQHIGSTMVFYVIVFMVHGVISMLPYFLGIYELISDTNTMNGQGPNTETLSFFGIMMIITFMLSTLLAYILGNLTWINQGIIYYSAREENENLSLHSEIDQIGRDSE